MDISRRNGKKAFECCLLTHLKKNKIVPFAILILLMLVSLCHGAEQFNGNVRPTKKTQNDDKWFAKDKIKHLTVSMFLSTAAYSVVDSGTEGNTIPIVTGVSFPISMGLFKEFKDFKKGGSWSYKDFVWDVIGTSIAISIATQID